jgi:formylglycine-generating enzyme required for sulfatase activity
MVLYFFMKKFTQPVRSLSFILTLASIVSFMTGCATWMSTDAAKATYMVIDLSGGTNAPSYPVRYLRSLPKGGWTDEYKTTKLVMRKIPAGTFTMGADPVAEHPRHTESSLHSVTLTKDFFIGVFEVTQRQWELVMGNRPSHFDNNNYYATRPVEHVSYYEIRENPTNSAICPNWPVSSQTHASSFMGKLRSKTGLSSFDLPTESQWEYACRAGTTTDLNTGYNLTSWDNDPHMNAVGRWKAGNRGRYIKHSDTSVGSAKVGSYLPNAWGLYDMHVNVEEWCLDKYGTYPGTVTDPLGAASGSKVVTRGGGWNYGNAYYCRSADRDCWIPDSRYYFIGFRVAMTLP